MDAAAAREALEWRTTVPEGASSVLVERHEGGLAARGREWLLACVAAAWGGVGGFAREVWRIGEDDPRKVVHGLKVGLSLALISVFCYPRPLYDFLGGAAMWSIMTVVFEDTVGGSVYKSFNKAVATASGVVLALGVHWVACKSGVLEPYILTGSLFLLGAAANFSRSLPAVNARFDYGVTNLVLTYSLLAMSGYHVDHLASLVQERVSTMAIGILMCLAVSVLISPVWAGQELHLLTTRNMDKLATSLEACVDDYFVAEEWCTTKKSSDSDGYKCVLNSKASEDKQASMARWEPPHGRFGFLHPYGHYRHVGAAMRACAYCVEALAAATCTRQAPEERRLLRGACTRVGARCARVLREASRSVSDMAAFGRELDMAVADMNTAAHELQGELRSMLPSVNLRAAEASRTMDTMPAVFTVASLMVEIAARVEAVVDAIEMMAILTNFKQVDDDNDGDGCQQKVHPLNEPDDNDGCQKKARPLNEPGDDDGCQQKAPRPC
ncbi:hypothetical protein HU200_002501 [Digitaria exilis]|uniref:Aluminum-activated malate transporter n=1 Tax=Digitaria exilis TaxID=1010633 RepID=A0A835FVL8_9POAL|nr:hypothetical protein HU200_002501 [Digitaria exilis]